MSTKDLFCFDLQQLCARYSNNRSNMALYSINRISLYHGVVMVGTMLSDLVGYKKL